MKRLTFLLFSLAFANQTTFSAESIESYKAQLDVNNKASLQYGAELFSTYCQGCHSVEFQRYNRTANDIGMSLDDAKTKLIHTGSYSTRDGEFKETKVGELMHSAMLRKDAMIWFGAAPIDLSTIVRAKGANYVYSYLNSFYMDEARPLGVNNITFPSVGMPHVLFELQGVYEANFEESLPEGCTVADDADCKVIKTAVSTKLVKPGTMTEEEYRAATNDLTNYLAYISEPAQIERAKYGPWVLGFIIIFTFFAYFLNREYWKDVK